MQQRLPIPRALQGMIWHHSIESERAPRHHHTELEANLCLSGTATYLVKQTRIQLRPRTLFWLFPGQVHQLIDRSKDFEMWIVVFRHSLAREVSCELPRQPLGQKDPPGIWAKTLALPAFNWMEELLRDLQKRTAYPGSFNRGLGYGLVRIWDLYLEAKSKRESSHVHPAVQKAVQLIARDPSLGEHSGLARLSGLSRSRLSHLFKKQMHISITGYRNRQRLQHFFHHYDHGRLTLLAAALMAGFGSYAQFHRVYRSLTGESPRAAHFRGLPLKG